ncbi:MAG: GNAT family N-acetyltransferase [Pseudomonadota bacterium]
MKIREANAEDIQQIVQLRMKLFVEVGAISHEDAAPELKATTLQYFQENTNVTKSWVAEYSGKIVAAGTLSLFFRPPYPENLLGKEGYLLNMYTLPEYRKKGCGKGILENILAYSRQEQLGKVWLHASTVGRPLYEKAGFIANSAYLEWIP